MKKLFFRFFFLILVIFLSGVLYLSIFKVKSNEIGMVYDLRTGFLVSTFKKRYNFVWQGICPFYFTIRKLFLQKSEFFDLELPLPSLEKIQSNIYSVKIPVNFIYKIDREVFFDYEKLQNGGAALSSHLKELLTGFWSQELLKYFDKRYERKRLIADQENLLKKVTKELKKELQLIGINLIKVNIVGNISYPTIETYLSGFQHLKKLRDLWQRDEYQNQTLQAEIKQDNLRKQENYKNLKEISKLIQDNPNLLKYIYINKISDKAKVVVAPPNLEVPFKLEENNLDSKNIKREIDNLK